MKKVAFAVLFITSFLTIVSYFLIQGYAMAKDQELYQYGQGLSGLYLFVGGVIMIAGIVIYRRSNYPYSFLAGASMCVTMTLCFFVQWLEWVRTRELLLAVIPMCAVVWLARRLAKRDNEQVVHRHEPTHLDDSRPGRLLDRHV